MSWFGFDKKGFSDIFVIVAGKVLKTDGIAIKLWKIKGLCHILF